MPENNQELDIRIIHDAYADRLRDSFRIFAENLGTGENENSCKERFARAVLLLRKARDIALDAACRSDAANAAAAALNRTDGAARESRSQEAEHAMEALSPEDQAMIEQALSGTTGAKLPSPPTPIRR